MNWFDRMDLQRSANRTDRLWGFLWTNFGLRSRHKFKAFSSNLLKLHCHCNYIITWLVEYITISEHSEKIIETF
ncbi:unnamed protein product [Schistosoma mattheei]|uniref:Uncharacterized protein n=1 Tax=Schistosoma mattheei TaxID=31246 RepID=A0A183NFE6_9TREM|nr:unnamed protein product [Schistosoma mattheei]